MAFITELWESVFTPGTTPALIKATHASFILLIISLISLIFLSRSIHFVNLLIIAILLYAAVIWFIKELEQVKLKDNDQLDAEGKEAEGTEAEGSAKPIATTTAVPSQLSPIKKRKA